MEERVSGVVYKISYIDFVDLDTYYNVYIVDNDDLSERSIYYLNKNGITFIEKGVLIKNDYIVVDSEYHKVVKEMCISFIRNRNLNYLIDGY